MASVKILLNDVVSSPGAKFATADIVDAFSQKALIKVLNASGYMQTANSYGLFTHVERGTCFSLVVESITVKLTSIILPTP